MLKMWPRACVKSGDTPDPETALCSILACHKIIARKGRPKKQTQAKVTEKLLETTSWASDTSGHDETPRRIKKSRVQEVN